VKPGSTTTHWTHCTTGGTAGNGSTATCTSSDSGHTPQTNTDVSKKYGNGKTAAQIAVSRGGVNVQLTGPGNSQPHKVAVCGKKANKSGGVDVHAVKSYSTTGCTQTTTATPAPTSPCGYVVVATTSETGTSKGHGKGLSHNKHETSTTSYSLKADSTQNCGSAPATSTPVPTAPCGYVVVTTTSMTGTSHGHGKGLTHNKHMKATTSYSLKADSTQNCGSATVTPAAPGTPVVPGTPTASGTPAANVAPVTQSAAAASPSTKSTAGGVLGAQTTLASPKPARGGVLGTVTHVAGSTLPFTGFPIWIAVLIALALILGGLALRRRGAAPTQI
jgi:hypothetical protein